MIDITTFSLLELTNAILVIVKEESKPQIGFIRQKTRKVDTKLRGSKYLRNKISS